MSHIPKHVAIIMDGNRRWAQNHGKSKLLGHLEGEKRIEPIIDRAIEKGIAYLTFWAFSTENWDRTKTEISFLLKFMRQILRKKFDAYHLKNVRMNFIGNLSKFPQDIQNDISGWKGKTKNNKKITVNMALNYGGRDEIVRAVNRIENAKMQEYKPVTSIDFEKYLDTEGQPDPDLLIRTGGEKRLSGFMLWQLEYTELYFTDTLWPDFKPDKFDQALEEYAHRVRRFGR